MADNSTTAPASSITAAKTTEDANNNDTNTDDKSVTSTASGDNLSSSEKRSLAAKKGWERKRELEKNARSPSKMRIVSSRSKRAAAKIAAAAIASPAEPKPTQVKPKAKASSYKGKSAGSAKALKGWETRKKKAAAAAASASSVASPTSSFSSSSSKLKSLTHSDAAKLGWERIRKKKAEEEAKTKAAAASKKKSSAGALSRSEAAKLGWERIRAKRVQDANESEEEEEEDNDVFKARSKSSKKGWETRKKMMMMQTKKAEAAAKAKEVKTDLFVVRSKSSKKGWETRRKMAEAAAKQEEEETDEWQQRSNASKKGWETRRRLEAEAAAATVRNESKKKSVAKVDKETKKTMSDWERKRKMQEVLDETSPEESPVSVEKPQKKRYTAAARSKAAKMAWQKAKDQKTLIAGTATAPSGRAYYQLASPVATQTYTAERVEWEIRQKMLAAANAEDSSSDEESEEEATSGVEDSTEEEHEEGSEENPAANISRDEAANLLLAMFGNSAPAAPAVKTEEISADETSQETSIAEALQELKGVKSEDTSYSVENHGQYPMIAGTQEVEETSLRGRKRKPSVKGSGYKHMVKNEDELTPFARAQTIKSSGGYVAVKPATVRYPPRSPPRFPKAATKKTSKQRSNTAKQGWQKRKNEVFKRPNFDPQDNEKINAAIAAVERYQDLQNDAPLPRGVTVRPSGKWQAQLYYAGKSRYIGVFDNRADACYAYEIARQILINCRDPQEGEVEVNINLARKAAFAGVSKY